MQKPFRPIYGPAAGGGSVVLIRAFGADEGMGMRPGMMHGMMQPPPGPAEGNMGGADQDPVRDPRQARVLWLEFSAGSQIAAQYLTLGIAVLISLGVSGLYAFLVRLYRRNLDLQDREAKNRELIQLGEAARTLAHEIRNPLAVIRLQTAAMRRVGSDAIAERVAVIDEEVERLRDLTDRIREFLKGGEGEPKPVELAAFLDDFVARYETNDGKRPFLAVERLEPGLVVRIDPARLSQALDNVVRNALEASEARRGGPSAGKAGEGPAARIVVSRQKDRVEIAIEDDGPGLAPELESRLFEPFFTTKEKGSGIGLALARKIPAPASRP